MLYQQQRKSTNFSFICHLVCWLVCLGAWSRATMSSTPTTNI